MRSVMLFVVWLVCGGLLYGATVQEKQSKPIESPLMKKKLEQAQKILEGLATKNFELMEKSAEELIIISKKVEWQALKTPEYQRLSDEFRRNADLIAKMSRAKHIDGAAMGYVRLTLNCVDCHNHIRESKVGMLDRK